MALLLLAVLIFVLVVVAADREGPFCIVGELEPKHAVTGSDGDGGQVDRGLSPVRFPSGFVLQSGDRVTIWTGEGTNTNTDLYWGYGVNMWNQERNTVIVNDETGETVLEEPYPDQTSSIQPPSDIVAPTLTSYQSTGTTVTSWQAVG